MYYEIYIDQFFAEHLLTGFLLLKLTALFLGREGSWKRILAASLSNAAAVTLAVIICTAGFWQGQIWTATVMAGGYLAGGAAAVRIAFGQSGKVLVPLLIMTVVFRGIQEALGQITGLAGPAGSILAGTVLGCLVICSRRKQLSRERKAEVIVYWEEKQQTLSGLIDTGNLLQEPLTGKAVSIVERESIRSLLGDAWQQRRGFYLIPYHSIGRDKGWLQAVTVDKMEVRSADRTVWAEQPVLAIYEGTLSAQKEYQIILHPQHAK